MPTLNTAPALAFVAIILSVAIGFDDWRSRRVRNHLLGTGFVLGALWLVVSFFQGTQGISYASSLLGLFAGLMSLLPFYAIGWMGAGDVKYFALLGFLLGWQALLPIWIIASLLAGVHAIAIIGLRRFKASTAHVAGLAAMKMPIAIFDKTRGTPYATCLAVGAIATIGWFAGHAHG